MKAIFVPCLFDGSPAASLPPQDNFAVPSVPRDHRPTFKRIAPRAAQVPVAGDWLGARSPAKDALELCRPKPLPEVRCAGPTPLLPEPFTAPGVPRIRKLELPDRTVPGLSHRIDAARETTKPLVDLGAHAGSSPLANPRSGAALVPGNGKCPAMPPHRVRLIEFERQVASAHMA